MCDPYTTLSAVHSCFKMSVALSRVRTLQGLSLEAPLTKEQVEKTDCCCAVHYHLFWCREHTTVPSWCPSAEVQHWHFLHVSIHWVAVYDYLVAITHLTHFASSKHLPRWRHISTWWISTTSSERPRRQQRAQNNSFCVCFHWQLFKFWTCRIFLSFRKRLLSFGVACQLIQNKSCLARLSNPY